ncbi:hypothetical protein STN0717CIT72_26670 [Citrobacter portucalensis]|nr:hypothetical protein STW0522CIT27_21020 [Citrobacter portucalensis]BBW41211.1 hypothetical protein STN0717CIT72_26670 [Citrobacter portucalensis]
MTHVHEAVKTRHKETSLVFPILALVVLFFWGSSQSLPVVIGINALALIGILSSAFSVVRHADVLAHRLGEPYGSLILSLSVVILEVSLISALMATGDAAPTLMRDTLYSIIMIVTGGLVGFSLLLGGRKFATQYMNLFGIKQYLIALFPLAIIVLVFPMALPGANFTTAQALLVALISAAMYGVFLLIQTKEAAIKWSAAPDMTPQTVLYRRPVAQFSNFQPKIVSSWLILALFQANFLISGRSRLCPYQLVNSNQVRQGE